MSNNQRELEHIVLINMVEKGNDLLINLTNKTIFDYWRHTVIYLDFASVINQSELKPYWSTLCFYNSTSYKSVCYYKWFKDLCAEFRAYIMRHFFLLDCRDCLQPYELVCTKKNVDMQKYLDI